MKRLIQIPTFVILCITTVSTVSASPFGGLINQFLNINTSTEQGGVCNIEEVQIEVSIGEVQRAWRCDNSVHQHPNRGLREEPGVGGCPAGMARIRMNSSDSLSDFCMDKFEASLVEVEGDSRTNDWSPFHNPGDRSVRAVSLRGARAQQFISGNQARLACERSGKRLCTNAEWQRACKGPDGATYPYTWPSHTGDSSRGAMARRYPAGSSKKNPPCHESVPAWSPGLYCQLNPSPKCRGRGGATNRMNEPCVAQIPMNQAALTGSFSKCVTPDGVYDLVGNVHEWTSDTSGTFRGGYFSDTKINGQGCGYATTAHDTGHADYSTGFRCCADL